MDWAINCLFILWSFCGVTISILLHVAGTLRKQQNENEKK